MDPPPSTIGSLNLLPEKEKRALYTKLVPPVLTARFQIPATFLDSQKRPLLDLRCASGNPDLELSLYHRAHFQDPVLYCHLEDTLNGQIRVLLYILNDPDSPRFDVDRMPDGSPTKFGSLARNLAAEQAALQAGLAPGQTRHGLRLLRPAILALEKFIHSLGHELYFLEPLYYHNAVVFERYGFAYQLGKKRMEHIQEGFGQEGDLYRRLDGSTPFRGREAAHSIRLRSWAIHDSLLKKPFTGVTMYKRVGKSAGVCTCPGVPW